MADRVRSAAILCSALLLSACQPPEIRIQHEVTDGRNMIHLSQDVGIIFSNRQAPCVREVTLFRRGKEMDEPAWQLELVDQAQCIDLATFEIGVAPPGFRDGVPFSRDGHRRYTLRVSGISEGEEFIVLEPPPQSIIR